MEDDRSEGKSRPGFQESTDFFSELLTFLAALGKSLKPCQPFLHISVKVGQRRLHSLALMELY